MRSKAERAAEFERREILRKEKYAAGMAEINAKAAARKAAIDEKYGPQVAAAAEQKAAREAARDTADLNRLAAVSEMKANATEPIGVGGGTLVDLMIVAAWNKDRKAKKRLRKRGLL